MTDIVGITLENEMDLVLAHKRSMKVGERLGLSMATQTTFATAVSEIARTVIEHTDNGSLTIGLIQNKQRYTLQATFTFSSDIVFTNEDNGYYYAQKLVPEFRMYVEKGSTYIEMQIGLPRSLRLDPLKILALKQFFLSEQPLNAYEEIKRRNISLNRITEEQEEELRQSKIIDEKKTEFISVASHEIKTPITIIKAYTQMAIKAGVNGDDKLRAALEKIDFQSAKLLALVQQLLDVSKIENGNLLYSMEHTLLDEFILDMTSVMGNILPHHRFVTDLLPGLNVNIDRLRMEQVFSNLIGNAAKYSDKDTTITLSCTLEDANAVRICISDQGIGMSEESIQSVFKKFYRDKDVLRTHGGLGMGLYVTSKIVLDHGGRIWAESTPGVGSDFIFTIPIAQPS